MKKKSVFTIDLFFALALFCAFAASVLLVLMIGAGVYRDAADEISGRFGVRTGAAYLSARVRAYNRVGGVEVGEFGGGAALILREDIAGEAYATYIYYRDGSLWELTASPGAGLAPEDGERIMEAGGLALSLEKAGLIRVVYTAPDGGETELLLNVVTGGGAT